ncbi:MAG: gamma-glutamyltransferase [Haliangiales bacterium]
MAVKLHRIATAAGSALTLAAAERVALVGGGAVDVAAAAALSAMVGEVGRCSLGGSAFVMVRVPGRVAEVIDGGYASPGLQRPRHARAPVWRARGQSPGTSGGVLDLFDLVSAGDGAGDGGALDVGPASVAVPGALAAVEALWRRYGTLPWRELVAPALELARDGFVPLGATEGAAGSGPASGQGAQETAKRDDGDGERHGDGEPAPVRMLALADALDYIAREGARGFYQGDIAALLARALAESGGHLTRADMAAYQATRRASQTLASGEFTLALNPAPAIGGVAAGLIIERLQRAWARAAETPDSAARARMQAEAQAEALGALSELEVPAVDSLAWQHQLSRALLATSTTHLSVTSADGWAIAITAAMGHDSGVSVPEVGVVWNNAASRLPRDRDGLLQARPGQRLISPLCPAIGWHARDPRVIALGSPGGPRIASAVAQVWARYALEGLGPEAAVLAPRLHVEATSEGERIHCEPGIAAAGLKGGASLRRYEQLDGYFGGVNCAAIDARGEPQSVCDRRRDGAASVIG